MGAPSFWAAALAVLFTVWLRPAGATEVVITAATTADQMDAIRRQVASSSEIARVSVTGTLAPAVNAALPGLFAGVTSVSGDVVMTSNSQDHSIVFPRCSRIGGALNLNARQATAVSFPQLRVVGGRLNIQAMCSVSGPDLSAGFASLETVGAGLIYSGWCGSRWVVHVGDDFELAALRSVGGEFHISIGFFGTLSVPLLESTGGAFKIIRQTHLQHIDAPSLTTVGGDMVFQGLQALHTVCGIALEEDGFGGSTVTVNAEGYAANTMGSIREMPPWMAERVVTGIRGQPVVVGTNRTRACSGWSARPLQIRTEEEYNLHAGNASLIAASTIGVMVISWPEISNAQLAALLQSKTEIGGLYLEFGSVHQGLAGPHQASALTSLDVALRQVRIIHGVFTVLNVPNLASISLPALTKIHTSFQVMALDGLRRISAPALTEVGDKLKLLLPPSIENVSFPALTHVNGTMTLDCHRACSTAMSAETLSAGFPVLRDVGAATTNPAATSLQVNYQVTGGTFELAALRVVKASLYVASGNFAAVRFPQLIQVTGGLRVWRQGTIREISFPRIATVGGVINIHQNGRLTSLCNFTLPESGIGSQVLVAENGPRPYQPIQMEPWIAEAAGLQGTIACPSREPTMSPSVPPTAAPSRAPTLSPSVAPTALPTRHACNDGSHGCDATAFGICEQVDAVDGAAGHRCSCANTHRCSDGDCRSAGHTCEWITVAPTTAPSSQPTAAPTSALPTAMPSGQPTTLYARDGDGNIVFPTDGLGAEVFATDAWGEPQVPTDRFGRPVTPFRPITATTITTTTTAAAAATTTITGGDSSASASGDGDGGDSSLMIAVVVAVVVLGLVIVAAVIFVKKVLGRSADSGGAQIAFDNPAYDTLGSGGGGVARDPGTSGYMDVPAAGTFPSGPAEVSAGAATAGYMDVAPQSQQQLGVDDDEEEDV